jgi:hypothetical protein
MFERRTQPLIPRAAFLQRIIRHSIVALFVVLVSLIIGVLGYHYLEGFSWVDAILNAAMILGGMGPVDTLHTTRGKLFAAAYALFSGVIFLVVAGILFAPLLHRLLHHFHAELEPSDQ